MKSTYLIQQVHNKLAYPWVKRHWLLATAAQHQLLDGKIKAMHKGNGKHICPYLLLGCHTLQVLEFCNNTAQAKLNRQSNVLGGMR